jgi:hypothetical protein
MRLELERRISPEPNTGCWLWVGNKNDRGYGVVPLEGKIRKAHRAVYESERGPIPEGLTLDHLCRIRCCVNPDHLEPVTAMENIRRGIAIHGGRNAIQAMQAARRKLGQIK